jgi:hypothetical protein
MAIYTAAAGRPQLELAYTANSPPRRGDMVRLQQFGGDLRRIIRGAAAFYRHLRVPERIQLGLGQFSADSSIVALGQPSRYYTRVANVSGETRHVTVCLDFYTMNALINREEHCGHVAKKLTIPSHTVTALEVQYDWRALVSLYLDGRPAPPDEFWHKSVHPPQGGLVRALLLDPEAHCLEQLTISQEVTG